MPNGFSPQLIVTALKAAAEPTRLRILLLLADAELSVKDMTRVLGQSQPRISRHLKLLTEAGLIERVREGSWAYFHLAENGPAAEFAKSVVTQIDDRDSLVLRDHDRLDVLRRERVDAAQAFFDAHAAEWDGIRRLHADQDEVEACMKQALGTGPFKLLVDLGTGTGRALELFAESCERAIGIDTNKEMLSYAKTKLDSAMPGRAQLRLGDINALSLDNQVADAVVMHQVLHFLDEPALAIQEAARILKPGGRLLIVDFAAHEIEALRETFAHVRLGFSSAQIEQWLSESGLEPGSAINLKPPADAGDDRLTVSIWLARRQHASAPREQAKPSQLALEDNT